MKCTNCGQKIMEGKNFCPNCGNEIIINENKKTKLIMPIISLCMLIFAFLIVFLFFVKYNGQEDTGVGTAFALFVLPLSIINIIASSILSIISIVDYSKDKKAGQEIKKSRKVFFCINIIQLTIIAITFILLVFKLVKDEIENMQYRYEENHNNYNYNYYHDNNKKDSQTGAFRHFSFETLGYKVSIIFFSSNNFNK